MITVRDARLPDDAPAIAAIDTSFSTETIFRVEVGEEAIRLREVTLDRPLARRLPLDDLADPDRPWETAFVAVDGQAIVGFVATARSSWSGRLTLWHLYVEPARRGRGVGRALVARVMDEAVASGAEHVWLETSNLNVPAVAFYRRLGFALCGADTTLYAGTPAEGETALFFARKV
ncbi:MAG TPA: GNAT family N-acetyltransferase [Caulobacteraceae bacterium]|nr:GNAT family N-acetyltransferase [Caulobacteraceae bacterium]